MSTAFKPLTLPPGVVATATKQMQATNYAEVNMVRWVEGQLAPIGGQSKYSSQNTGAFTAATSFTTASTIIGMVVSNPGWVKPGMTVTNQTTGHPVGTVQSFKPGVVTLSATAAFTTDYAGIAMPPNPGWVVAGMSVTDTTNSQPLGTVATYGPKTATQAATGFWSVGAINIPMSGSPVSQVIPGMVVVDLSKPGANILGIVLNWIGSVLTLTAPAPFGSQTPADILQFSSGSNHVLTLTAAVLHASAGANDALQFSGGAAGILTLTAPAASASSGSADVLQISGESYLFESRCKAIHGWYDLAQVHNVAYLCEQHLYVDRGGSLLDITPVNGIVPPTPPSQGGYGDGAYNTGPPDTYGTPRTLGADAAIDRVPDAFSLQNFGAILLAMTSADGRLLHWDPASAPGTLATVVTPASGSTVPNGRCFVVTSERFVQIFGAYNDGTAGAGQGGSFRRFAWCEQEDFTNWSYSDLTTQAGFIDIEPSSPIITATATRTGTLFFTATKAYRSRFLGSPYIYNYDELADNCTPWSPQSLVTTTSMVLWFSQQGPYSYDGTSILPVQCMVRAWVDDDIDLLNVREQACAIHVANFNEFWWCFPQGPQSNPSGFNTRAIVYNYKEGWWGQARCARSAGVTASYTSHTIMANGMVAYEHENGFTYWDCDLPWIETFDLNINGGKLITVKQMMPDIEGSIGGVLYSLFYRNSRTIGLPELQTTRQPVRSNGYVDFRTTGRDMRLRIDLAAPLGMIINGVASDGSVYPVTVGQHLIDLVPRGDR